MILFRLAPVPAHAQAEAINAPNCDQSPLAAIRSNGRLSRWIGNREFAADPLCEQVRKLHVPGHGLGMASLRVFPKRVLLAFPSDDTTVAPQVSE